MLWPWFTNKLVLLLQLRNFVYSHWIVFRSNPNKKSIKCSMKVLKDSVHLGWDYHVSSRGSYC